MRLAEGSGQAPLVDLLQKDGRTMKRSIAAVLMVCLALVPCFGLASDVSAQGRPAPVDVGFATNVVASTSAGKAVQLKAKLYMPAASTGPVSAVVITPSSGGVKSEIELHYAQALADGGIAALVIDSFGSRGLVNSIADQRVLTEFQTSNDAIGGLRWLAADARFRADRIGITGLSKGGGTALKTALNIQRRWMGASAAHVFAAHAPIAPGCNWLNRSLATTGAPIFLMLAELDDQTPAAPCMALAEKLRQSGNSKVEVKVYKGAHHAWEVLGAKPYFDRRAENYSKCRVTVGDDGRMINDVDGSVIPREGWHEWAKRTCMTLGTHCCGGNAELKRQATADLVAFFKRNGF